MSYGEGELYFSIITPDKEYFSGEVKSINTQGTDGRFGVLKNHSPFIAVLIPTVTKFTDMEGIEHTVNTSSGLFKVADNKAVLLCDKVEDKNS